jgi:hypothetical protein
VGSGEVAYINKKDFKAKEMEWFIEGGSANVTG